uniref:Uncharacterized protein n=1 Tax=Anopheles farauti TaxID=69004 RepID=A0A182QCW0_9DIPT
MEIGVMICTKDYVRFGVLEAKLTAYHLPPIQPRWNVDPHWILRVHHVCVQQWMIVAGCNLYDVRISVLTQYIVRLKASTDFTLLPNRPVMETGVLANLTPTIDVHERARFRFDVLGYELLEGAFANETYAHAFLFASVRF